MSNLISGDDITRGTAPATTTQPAEVGRDETEGTAETFADAFDADSADADSVDADSVDADSVEGEEEVEPGPDLIFHLALQAFERGPNFTLEEVANAIEAYDESPEATVMLSLLLRDLSRTTKALGGNRLVELLKLEESFAEEVLAAETVFHSGGGPNVEDTAEGDTAEGDAAEGDAAEGDTAEEDAASDSFESGTPEETRVVVSRDKERGSA